MTTTAPSVVQRTVLDRLLESGITHERALHHLSDGWVRVDGDVVTDPALLAEPPARIEIRILGEAGSWQEQPDTL